MIDRYLIHATVTRGPCGRCGRTSNIRYGPELLCRQCVLDAVIAPPEKTAR